MEDFSAWLGREETAEDLITPRLAAAFNATFDLPDSPGALPLGIHWCLALALAPNAALGPDGHPARGDFLPPIPLPRRMWAGGQLTFHDNLRIGDAITRTSRITAITPKQGATGPLYFVMLEHQIISPRGLAITEQQDIVYRAAQSQPAPANGSQASGSPVHNLGAKATWRQAMQSGPVTLFRYSALTFNGHRIHYDRDYATSVEHYSGLIVHGPLQATWLLAHAARHGSPSRFTFRALTPLTDLDDFTLNARAVEGGLELWIETASGARTMRATAAL